MTRVVKIKVRWFSSEHRWKRKNLWISAENDWISMRAQPGLSFSHSLVILKTIVWNVTSMHVWFQEAATVMNNSCNFFFYLLASSHFRKQFLYLFKKKSAIIAESKFDSKLTTCDWWELIWDLHGTRQWNICMFWREFEIGNAKQSNYGPLYLKKLMKPTKCYMYKNLTLKVK